MKAHTPPQSPDDKQILSFHTSTFSPSPAASATDDDDGEEEEEEENASLYPRPPRRNRSKLFWTVIIVALFFFLWPTAPQEAGMDTEETTVQDMTVVWVSKEDIYYYHLDKNCPGLTNPMEWVRSEAEKRNYFPCPVCAKE